MTYNLDNMSIFRPEINLFSVMDENFPCAVKFYNCCPFRATINKNYLLYQ